MMNHRYKVCAAIASIFIVAACLSGCGEDVDLTSSNGAVDGRRLLGLIDGRILTYLQIDTVTTWYPAYERFDTTAQHSFSVSGANDDWVIHDGALPALNLKLTDESILLNGNWSQVQSNDVLFFFASPTRLMKRSLTEGEIWSGSTPLYQTGTEGSVLPLYNAYFGLYYTKRYAGHEALTLPAGELSAYRFNIELFLSESDDIPIATATEYYALDIGPVLLIFQGASLHRTLSLIDYSDAAR